MKSTKPTAFYKNIFSKTSTEQQAAFLEQLFAKDADLRTQFNDFIAAWATTKPPLEQPTLSFVDLEKYRKKVRRKLSGLEFDKSISAFSP